mgnify:CR=1 FL=1
MLKEIIADIPVELPLQNLKNILPQDFINFISEKCGVNLEKIYEPLTSAEIENVVETAHYVYEKIFASSMLTPESKIVATDLIFGKLFERWKNSDTPELFFIKIQAKFTPAQIVNAIYHYAVDWQKYKWIINFFAAHKQIFPRQNKKIRTVGIYYTRLFSGGVERFISMIIPTYIQLGYRVILFTDIQLPKQEFPLPPQSEFFERVNFSTSRLATLRRLEEFSTLLKKYNVDLLISHMRAKDFPVFVQLLFCRLEGVKIAMQLHGSIMHEDFRFPKALSYSLSDAMTVLSKTRKTFLENFGLRAYYIPNPINLDAANFGGRDTKNFSNIILWVGRIAADKNPFAALAIMKRVVKKIPTAKLKIIGAAENPSFLEKFRNAIQTNGLEENVELCGYHTNIKNFYEQADVLLNTSPHEGWALVIAESKFYELPLVLYELPDNELTQDGKGCISVAQGDSYAAAQAIIKILTDTDFRRKLSIQARESIQPFLNYDIGGAWQRLFDDLEKDSTENLRDSGNSQIQSILLEEIFKLQQQVKKSSN